MTENQFFNILTDIRSEQLNVYVLGVDPAISEKDFSAQVNVFKKYFDQEFDPKTSPKCPIHNIFLEKTGLRTYHCPHPGCDYTWDSSPNTPKCPIHNYKTRTYRCPKCTYTEDID